MLQYQGAWPGGEPSRSSLFGPRQVGQCALLSSLLRLPSRSRSIDAETPQPYYAGRPAILAHGAGPLAPRTPGRRLGRSGQHGQQRGSVACCGARASARGELN